MEVIFQQEKRVRTFSVLNLLAYVIILCVAVMIAKTAMDAYNEKQQGQWRKATATIAQRTVRKIPAGSKGEWFIELAVRYTVDGEELTSNFRSRGGSFWEEPSMRRWAASHPPGTSLAIRYDPKQRYTIVADEADMPESGRQAADDLKAILVFLILASALKIAGRRTRQRQSKIA